MHNLISDQDASGSTARNTSQSEGQSRTGIQSDLANDSHSRQSVGATSNRSNGQLPEVYQFSGQHGRHYSASMLQQLRLNIHQMRIPLVLQKLWHWANSPGR